MALPIMPKLTAIWLLDNTALTFKQIATFCGMHELEIQAIADDENNGKIQGLNPVSNGQLTQEEIDRCSKKSSEELVLAKDLTKASRQGKKSAKYVPISKRGDKPDAIAWFLKQHPDELTDAQIVRLVGTTKNTIEAVRSKAHWNHKNIKTKDPVSLGLCKSEDIVKALERNTKKNLT